MDAFLKRGNLKGEARRNVKNGPEGEN